MGGSPAARRLVQQFCGPAGSVTAAAAAPPGMQVLQRDAPQPRGRASGPVASRSVASGGGSGPSGNGNGRPVGSGSSRGQPETMELQPPAQKPKVWGRQGLAQPLPAWLPCPATAGPVATAFSVENTYPPRCAPAWCCTGWHSACQSCRTTGPGPAAVARPTHRPHAPSSRPSRRAPPPAARPVYGAQRTHLGATCPAQGAWRLRGSRRWRQRGGHGGRQGAAEAGGQLPALRQDLRLPGADRRGAALPG